MSTGSTLPLPLQGTINPLDAESWQGCGFLGEDPGSQECRDPGMEFINVLTTGHLCQGLLTDQYCKGIWGHKNATLSTTLHNRKGTESNSEDPKEGTGLPHFLTGAVSSLVDDQGLPQAREGVRWLSAVSVRKPTLSLSSPISS
jgi:hypothetical protein